VRFTAEHAETAEKKEIKYEIRKTKYETSTNDKNSNIKTLSLIIIL
jgi:hypothetical protein